MELAHGKLVTRSYLYYLNVGPLSNCPFCSLFEETANHVIWNCIKLALYWNDLLLSLGLSPSLVSRLHLGLWLTSSLNPWAKAMIVALAWLIWME